MKLRHLEIFYAVMTCGSLSRAAEALNISQPAASKALKSAEMKLGFTLFQRVRGKLLPTSEAITLFEKAQSIYQDLDNLRLLADNLARDPRAKITLGCLPSLGLSLVPELVTDFYQQNSNLVMTLTTEHTETLVKKLDLREIDLALTLQPVQQGEILTTLIAEVPLVYIDRHYRQGAVEIDQIDQQLRSVGVGIPVEILGDVDHALVQIVELVEPVDRTPAGIHIAAEEVAGQQETVVVAQRLPQVGHRLLPDGRRRGRYGDQIRDGLHVRIERLAQHGRSVFGRYGAMPHSPDRNGSRRRLLLRNIRRRG